MFALIRTSLQRLLEEILRENVQICRRYIPNNNNHGGETTHAQSSETCTLSLRRSRSTSSNSSSNLLANGKVLCIEHAIMEVDNSTNDRNSASQQNHHHVNGISNGYSSSDKHKSSKSEHKDKHRDKDKDRKHSSSSSRSKDHKSSSRDKDKDKSRHHSSSNSKEKTSSSSHKSSSRDKDKNRHRDKDSGDKDRHNSSSSKDKQDRDKSREHKSSKDHKSSSRDKDKDRDRSKEHRDKEKDKHRHSSSSGKDRHRDKHRDKDKDRHRDRDRKDKDRKSDKHHESSEKVKVEIIEIKDSPELAARNGVDEDDQKLVIKEEAAYDSETEKNDQVNNSAASSCDYNISQFKDELKFETDDQEDDEPEQEEEEFSDEDVPLAARLQTSKRKFESDDEEEEKPLSARKKPKKEKTKKRNHSDDDDEEEEDIKPAKQKHKKKGSKTSVKEESEPVSPKKRKKKAEEEQEVWKWWEEEKRDDGTKWKFLEHKGPVFAPAYERIPKNVKFYYDGKEMHLSQDTEEIAGFYAKMLDHDYTTKEVFNNNFFKDWRKCMTDDERKKITELKKCNFSKMHAYFMDVAEKNRNRTKEEKLALKEKNEEILKEYGFCTIDGHKEKIGNFKIEPPGLFRGRGEHPKMGMLKRRLMPEDVLINCSKDSAIPKPPAGHKWKEVRHDPSVTWLASWTENVQYQVKYIMLNPSSKLKGEKDWQKYETARRLHKCIDKIRAEYRDNWKSKEMRIRQRAVALYFIDKLALRAGNEKDEDQADTVGCCSLRIEHIQLHEHRDDKDYVVVFDFLGKDSIRYYNEVPVEKRVFKNLQLFMDNKSPGDDLFDRLNTAVLNKHLLELMEGLTAKVFRTYNASFTLQQQLDKLTNADDSLSEKLLAYNRANRAVAILCNHQRAVPKGHAKSMEKLKEKIDAKRDTIKDAERGVKDAQRDAKRGSVKEKQIYDKKKKQLEKLREQLARLEIQETDRDENKTIALGTSKLNYLDPRISVAWCKKYDVPIEKIFNKTQRDKFRWAIDMAGPDYVF